MVASNVVAVTGMGVVSSIGTGCATFCSSLREGISGIRNLPESIASASQVKIGAAIIDYILNDRLAELQCDVKLMQKITDVTRRASVGVQVAIGAAVEAWIQARLNETSVKPSQIGIVVAGSNLTTRAQYDQYERFVLTPEYLNPNYALEFLDSDHVGTLSEIFGIKGEGFTVGGASASGNMAIHHARRMVNCGDVKLCLVVGAMADLSAMELQGFKNLDAMAGKKYSDEPQNACRPFDRQHEGFVYGQAAACLVLENVDSAQRRDATVLAKISGSAVVLDANRLANPSQAGEYRAMLNALQCSGLSTRDIDYINTHGSSSALGDETEISAIRDVFGDCAKHIWINSTKSLTGHCLYSAGVVEAVATILQMNAGFVHGNKNLDDPIYADGKFSREDSVQANIGAAMSNSFGFGGINTSIVLEKGLG